MFSAFHRNNIISRNIIPFSRNSTDTNIYLTAATLLTELWNTVPQNFAKTFVDVTKYNCSLSQAPPPLMYTCCLLSRLLTHNQIVKGGTKSESSKIAKGGTVKPNQNLWDKHGYLFMLFMYAHLLSSRYTNPHKKYEVI